MSLTWRHAMTSWRHGVMTQIARNVCHQLEVLWKNYFGSFCNPLGRQMKEHKNYSCHMHRWSCWSRPLDHLSTLETCETKNNHLSSTPNDWNRNGQYSGQATLTNKVNGARDKANFDFIELFYPKNVWNKKNNHLSSTPNDWNRNGQFSGQATLTNKVNGAYDKANFDFIELVYPKNVWNKNTIVFLAPQMTEIEMVSLVVKRPWPTKSTVRATKLISISLKLSTLKMCETKTQSSF